MRARERWAECAVALETLEGELREAARTARPALLCLGCAALIPCTQASSHRGPRCVPVRLNPPAADTGLDAVGEAIENFRSSCQAAGAPHYDLDCYIFNQQMIFTWRPLPEADTEAAPR